MNSLVQFASDDDRVGKCTGNASRLCNYVIEYDWVTVTRRHTQQRSLALRAAICFLILETPYHSSNALAAVSTSINGPKLLWKCCRAKSCGGSKSDQPAKSTLKKMKSFFWFPDASSEICKMKMATSNICSQPTSLSHSTVSLAFDSGYRTKEEKKMKHFRMNRNDLPFGLLYSNTSHDGHKAPNYIINISF